MVVREPVWRRLAVVLAAHAAGFNRLTGLDGEGTRVQLMERLRVLAHPNISERCERVVKNAARDLPAVFSNVANAMRCVKRRVAERHTEMPEERRIEFRVVAGICASARVPEYKQGQLDVFFEDAGQPQLENVARPRPCDIPRGRKSQECVRLHAQHTTPASTTILVHHSLR